MPQPGVVLIQKSGSPLAPVIHGAVSQILSQPLWEAKAPPLPPAAACGGALVLWDLWSFGAAQREAWLPALEPLEVGVVLALPTVERELDPLARRVGALGLLTPNLSPQAASVIVSLARAIQERICGLLAQRAALEQQLDDREVIERAKSVLMASLQISEAEAMRRLQRHARNTNQKLVRVAEKVLSSFRIFNDEPR